MRYNRKNATTEVIPKKAFVARGLQREEGTGNLVSSEKGSET